MVTTAMVPLKLNSCSLHCYVANVPLPLSTWDFSQLFLTKRGFSMEILFHKSNSGVHLIISLTTLSLLSHLPLLTFWKSGRELRGHATFVFWGFLPIHLSALLKNLLHYLTVSFLSNFLYVRKLSCLHDSTNYFLIMTMFFCILTKNQHFYEIPKCASVTGIGNWYNKVFGHRTGLGRKHWIRD